MSGEQATSHHTAICEIHLEQLDQGIGNLHGYEQAFVVYRLRGSVVGQVWMPVRQGYIAPAALRAHLPAMAWPIWQLLMDSETSVAQSVPTASVVVCTRDRTADLTNCLPGLQGLAVQGHDVIVVDSCPATDDTARLMARYPAIRYIHEPRPGLDVARNHGLLAARGEIVAFTDDDAQVDAGWLAALLRNFADPMVALVTGITMPLELETAAQSWFERTNGFGRGFVRKQFDNTTTEPLAAGRVGAGVNMAIRRSALDHIGLFDEALDCGTATRSGGDQEFFYRVLARGYRVIYEPAALVWHRHRREWSALQQALYGYGVGVFAWWTRTLLVEHDLTLLKLGPSWFCKHYIGELVKALLKRPGHMPRDLAWAEFRGALVGARSYLRARNALRRQQVAPAAQPLVQGPEQHAAAPLDQTARPATGQTLLPPNQHVEVL
jgi:GT2 family glycosyltransferase